MTARLLLPGVVVLLLAAQGNDDPAAQDHKNLAGTWTPTSLVYNGKDHISKSFFRFVFKGEQIIVEGNAAVEREYARINIKLDPGTTPRCMDMTVTAGVQKDAAIEGIYELKGDELKICAKVFGKDRPVEFTSPDGSSVVLIVLKRDK